MCVCVCVHTCIYVQRSFLKTLSIKQNDVASIIKKQQCHKYVKSERHIHTFYVNFVRCRKPNIRYLLQFNILQSLGFATTRFAKFFAHRAIKQTVEKRITDVIYKI